MNDERAKQTNVVETTDCLEAVGVFRRWKNFFFLIVFLSLLVVQGAFWLVDRKIILIGSPAEPNSPGASAVEPNRSSAAGAETVGDANEAAIPPADTSSIREALDSIVPADLLDFKLLSRIVEVANAILLVTAVLYCLAMFFNLVVSLIGRLGGLAHISRAFFLSLIMLVLLIPWQRLLGPHVMGATYSPQELTTWMAARGGPIVNTVLYYLRFCGYWVLVMLLLIFSQVRSARWTRSILRRLEII